MSEVTPIKSTSEVTPIKSTSEVAPIYLTNQTRHKKTTKKKLTAARMGMEPTSASPRALLVSRGIKAGAGTIWQSRDFIEACHPYKREVGLEALLNNASRLQTRAEPIMLNKVPIMLCCTAPKIFLFMLKLNVTLTAKTNHLDAWVMCMFIILVC